MRMPREIVLVCALLLSLVPGIGWAQGTQDFAEMSLEQLMQVAIEVASGVAEPISEAPAVVSVITAEQMEAMGALTLREVLDTVPGFHLYQDSPAGYGFAVRGVAAQGDPHLLVIVDGVPITQQLNGGFPLPFRMPAEVIARVEVIRGPGSAVFGADAFSGVINIITKQASDIAGTQVGAKAGSFGTHDGWLQYGSTSGEWEVALNVAWQETDGDDGRIIGMDLQSVLDAGFGTNASLAPGPLSTQHDVLDAHLRLKRGNWGISVWNADTKAGQWVGLAQTVLDTGGYLEAERLQLDLTYDNEAVGSDWAVHSRLTYVDLWQNAMGTLFPPGSVLLIGADGNINFANPAGAVLFSDGVRANPGDTEKTLRFDTSAVYSGADNHRLRFGAGYADYSVDTHSSSNYGPGALTFPFPPVVGGEMTVLTDTEYVFVPDQERNLYWLVAQDEWSITPKLEATLGARYDRYSDFGNTFNPRGALVWKPRSGFIAKVLYGSAFRVPTLDQLYAANNPSRLGNPNLDPQELTTFELVFDWRPTARFRSVLNLFRTEINGLVEHVLDPATGVGTAQNASDQESQGFELEIFMDLADNLRLQAHYSQQDSENKETGVKVPNLPKSLAYLSARWSPAKNFYIFSQAKWVGQRERNAAVDPRPALDSFTLVDLTARYKGIGEFMDLGFSVRNLFDEDAFDPSPLEIPGDLPMEGRRYLADVRFHF